MQDFKTKTIQEKKHRYFLTEIKPEYLLFILTPSSFTTKPKSLKCDQRSVINLKGKDLKISSKYYLLFCIIKFPKSFSF